MGYISATHVNKKRQVAVWERKDPSQRILRLFPADYSMYVDDEEGECLTIYDTRVSRVTFDTSKELSDAKKRAKEQGKRVWESDLTPEFRTLSKHYHDVPAPHLNISMLDIEVAIETKVFDPTHVIKIRMKSDK